MFDDGAHTDATWRDYKESIEAVRVSPKQASEPRYLLLSGLVPILLAAWWLRLWHLGVQALW